MTAQRTPFETGFGTGWVVFAGDTVLEITLPGRHVPLAEDAEPPRPIAAIVAALVDFYDRGVPFPSTYGLERLAGTPGLQRRIYEVVASIPPGSTMSYGEVAVAAGNPRAAQAVGAAMAANPYAPIIPCHRVLAAGGKIGGYAGGIAMKRSLLDRETGTMTLDGFDV